MYYEGHKSHEPELRISVTGYTLMTPGEAAYSDEYTHRRCYHAVLAATPPAPVGDNQIERFVGAVTRLYDEATTLAALRELFNMVNYALDSRDALLISKTSATMLKAQAILDAPTPLSPDLEAVKIHTAWQCPKCGYRKVQGITCEQCHAWMENVTGVSSVKAEPVGE